MVTRGRKKTKLKRQKKTIKRGKRAFKNKNRSLRTRQKANYKKNITRKMSGGIRRVAQRIWTVAGLSGGNLKSFCQNKTDLLNKTINSQNSVLGIKTSHKTGRVFYVGPLIDDRLNLKKYYLPLGIPYSKKSTAAIDVDFPPEPVSGKTLFSSSPGRNAYIKTLFYYTSSCAKYKRLSDQLSKIDQNLESNLFNSIIGEKGDKNASNNLIINVMATILETWNEKICENSNASSVQDLNPIFVYILWGGKTPYIKKYNIINVYKFINPNGDFADVSECYESSDGMPPELKEEDVPKVVPTVEDQTEQRKNIIFMVDNEEDEEVDDSSEDDEGEEEDRAGEVAHVGGALLDGKTNREIKQNGGSPTFLKKYSRFLFPNDPLIVTAIIYAMEHTKSYLSRIEYATLWRDKDNVSNFSNSPVPWIVIGQIIFKYITFFINKRTRVKKYIGVLLPPIPKLKSIINFGADIAYGQTLRTLSLISPIIIVNIANTIRFQVYNNIHSKNVTSIEPVISEYKLIQSNQTFFDHLNQFLFPESSGTQDAGLEQNHDNLKNSINTLKEYYKNKFDNYKPWLFNKDNHYGWTSIYLIHAYKENDETKMNFHIPWLNPIENLGDYLEDPSPPPPSLSVAHGEYARAALAPHVLSPASAVPRVVSRGPGSPNTASGRKQRRQSLELQQATPRPQAVVAAP